MIKIVLNESVTDIVYHYRNPVHAARILEKDEFICSVAYSDLNIPEVTKGKLYYLSLARTTLNKYALYSSLTVAFKLNGRKLSQKYRSFPIDYFNPWGTIPKTHSMIHSSDEMEDRIVTDEPTIKNAKKYILAIDVLVNVEMITSKHFDSLIKIDHHAKAANIPFHIYINREQFATRNASRSKKGSFDSFQKFAEYINNNNVKLDIWDVKEDSAYSKKEFRTLRGTVLLLAGMLNHVVYEERDDNSCIEDVKRIIHDNKDKPDHAAYLIGSQVAVATGSDSIRSSEEVLKTMKVFLTLMKKMGIRNINEIIKKVVAYVLESEKDMKLETMLRNMILQEIRNSN